MRPTLSAMPHLLFVCHGNVARSPAAQVIARDLLGPGAAWQVSSAGIGALVGQPVADDVALALRERGHDPGGHAARQVTGGMAQAADLVVCMAGEQRAWLVDEVPGVARKILVLGQAERLAASAPRHVAGLAHLVLSQEPAVPDDDVRDPYLRGLDAARATVQRLERGVGTVLSLLAP